MPSARRYGRPLRDQSVGRLLGRAAEASMLAMVLLLVIGLFMGYRPVILVTGSMAPTAPAGSLIIVADVPRGQVQVNDIIVMQRDGGRLLTHRIVELSEQDGGRIAVTKGDANATPDPIPYEIEADQRVVKFVAPVVGSLLLPLAGGTAVLLLVIGVLLGLGLLIRDRLPATPAAEPAGTSR